MDEVFGSENFVSIVSVEKTTGASSTLLPSVNDYLIWFAKDLPSEPVLENWTVG
jgi:adenine-specific DNA-methyltransferase